MDVAPCTWCPLTLPERYGRRPLVPYMGTMPIPFTVRAHASKDCFSNCIFTLVWLDYLIVSCHFLRLWHILYSVLYGILMYLVTSL
ncbi:Uncharacterized protein M6B38_238295 [Iris pallida]|uniref:Uncharacterized protein n=1 Tax=Iris pallida TaxID=29817 RepID=A0AAX6DLF6_IRIPA|nr:Uncharacterized protein M6B38_238295 [Iris pallida]